MDFQIAGVRFHVAEGDPGAASIVKERYAAYGGAPAAPPLRTVRLRVSAMTRRAADLRTGADVTYQRRGGRLEVERVDFRGAVDLDGDDVNVATSGVGGAQSFLRIACSLLLAPVGGLLVHAASVLRGGRAYLFVGESGAGKTTIARLSAPSLILSDEVSAVVPTEAGGDRYLCHATPFWGDLATDLDDDGRLVTLKEQPAAAPLARILLPRKAGHDALVPVPPSSAFVELAREAFAFGEEEEVLEAITESCSRLAERAPAAELRFRKSAAFWSLLDPSGA